MKINVEYYSRRCLLGLIWAIMTIGVYITYRILGIADLTVEGTLAMGAAIAANSISNGTNPILQPSSHYWADLQLTCNRIIAYKVENTCTLSGILTMIALYSINLHNGKSQYFAFEQEDSIHPISKHI